MGGIYFTDSQAFTLLCHTKIDGSPVKLLTIGLFDIECKTFVTTREGNVFILKKSGKGPIQVTSFLLRSYPIGMCFSINQVRLRLQ